VALHGALDPPLADRVAAVARTYRVTRRAEHVEVLLDAGLDSAWAISRLDGEAFVERFADALGARGAAAIHRHAQAVHAQAMGVLTRHRRELDRVRPAVLPPPPADSAVPAEWAALFGSVDFCECEHCRSVLSPAAYLVDLLQFLGHQPGDGRRYATALDALLARRPDLAALELTCANTTTILPTIDLIAELCERRISGRPAPTASTRPSEELASSRSTSTTRPTARSPRDPSARPAAEPPVGAQFRVHLERLGTPRNRLIEAPSRTRRSSA
jgi:hypothetical protein